MRVGTFVALLISAARVLRLDDWNTIKASSTIKPGEWLRIGVFVALGWNAVLECL